MNPPSSALPPAYSGHISEQPSAPSEKTAQQQPNSFATPSNMPQNIPPPPPIHLTYPQMPMGRPLQYNQFPNSVILTTNLTDLANRNESCLATCPVCNMTSMTIVHVKCKTVLLVLAIICFLTAFPAIIGFILFLFTFYRTHVCPRCNFEMSRAQVCC